MSIFWCFSESYVYFCNGMKVDHYIYVRKYVRFSAKMAVGVLLFLSLTGILS